MKSNKNYPFLSINLRLTAEALEWLSGTTTNNDGKEIPNMALFSYLLKDMRTTAGYDDSFRRPLNLKPGQMQFSEISLAERWNFGRKKIHNILSRMEAAGLVGSLVHLRIRLEEYRRRDRNQRILHRLSNPIRCAAASREPRA